jgi:hypothetical protein
MRFCGMILLVLGMSLPGYAADDPFAGKWKLNMEKSKFSPAPEIKSETVTISGDGKVTIDETDKSDKPTSWSYTAQQGKEVPITGLEGDSSVTEKKTGNKVAHTWKLSGKPSTGNGVISKDGKTMTYRLKGTGHDGKPMNNVMIFEKEQ